MTDIPIQCTWDGESLTPVNQVWARRADQQWVVGERYAVEIRHERSIASHGHFFAALNEAWANLPEQIAERFPTAESLRKYALIRAGFRDERSFVCSSKAEARRFAAFVQPMDDFAVVTVSEAVVSVYTAKSQSMRAMGKKQFEDSKARVLDYVSSLIGTSTDELKEQAA